MKNAGRACIEQSVENYELLELIGHGGMSLVYSARDRLLGRKVAIKFLKQELGKQKSSLERFVNEARTACMLKHANIIEVLAFGVSKKGEPYMIMEYLEGQTLDSIMENQRLNLSEFKEIFLPILDALAFAHENHYIHRDLKPGNIMLIESGEAGSREVKLLDFGIAKNLDSMSKKQQLTTGLLGTPKYISPEQCAGSPADYRSDVYSLACIMYEAIVGEVPFENDSPMQTMYKRMTESLATISRFTSTQGFSLDLLNTIVRALSKNPDERPQNAGEFRREICKAINSCQRSAEPGLKTRIIKALLLMLFTLPLVAFGLFLGSSLRSKNKAAEIGNATHNRGTIVTGVRQATVLNEAYVFSSQGRYKEAEPKFKEAIAKAEQTRSDDKLEWLYSAHLGLANNYLYEKKTESAYKEALKAADVFTYPVSSKRLRAIELAAEFLVQEKKEEAALELLRQACKSAEAELDEQTNASVGDSYYKIAKLLDNLNRKEEAQKAIEGAFRHYERSPLGLCRICSIEAAFLSYKLKKESGASHKDAELVLSKASRHLTDNKEETGRVAYYFGRGLEECGRPEEAAKYYRLGLDYAKYRDTRDCKQQSEDMNRAALARLSKTGIQAAIQKESKGI